MGNGKIFVNINSREDHTLVLTIMSLLKNAKNPERITFGIGMAYEEDEIPNLAFIKDRAKTIIWTPETIPGVVRGRYEVSQLADDEEYTLIIDSHTLFTENWDEKAIDFLNQAEELSNSSKVMISGTGNKIDHDHVREGKIRLVKEFVVFRDSQVRAGERPEVPVPHDRPHNNNIYYSGFFDCSFIFSKSNYYSEVGFDSISNFIAEEPYASLKAWGNGWDIYAPIISLANQHADYYFNTVKYSERNLRPYYREDDTDPNIISLEVNRAFINNEGVFSIPNMSRNIKDFAKLFNYNSSTERLANQEEYLLNLINTTQNKNIFMEYIDKYNPNDRFGNYIRDLTLDDESSIIEVLNKIYEKL